MKIDKNIWMFGLGALGAASFSTARPASAGYFNTTITEFRDNYTANFMFDHAVAHHGSDAIDPVLLRPQLFNETGFLGSQKLWNAWKNMTRRWSTLR